MIRHVPNAREGSGATDAVAVRTSVIFLNWYDGGQAYTEGEYRAWLTDAGFVEITREEGLGGIDLFRARQDKTI